MHYMEEIDEKEVPYYDSGTCKWYVAKKLQNYIDEKQSSSLVQLINIGCFIVIGKNIKDLVLIDEKQNILDSYPYNINGCQQIIAKINILKVSKNYEEHEKTNV